MEKLVKDNGYGVRITQYEMPTFFFQERIVNSITKIAQSVCFQSYDNLEEVSDTDLGLIFYFDIALCFNGWKVFNAFFDVSRSIAVKKIEETVTFFFILYQVFQVCKLFIFLLLGDLVDFFNRKI